jgi:hypothetical protein
MVSVTLVCACTRAHARRAGTLTQFVPYGVDDGSIIIAARAPGDGGDPRAANLVSARVMYV